MPRRSQWESLVQENPNDVFARYSLALACRSEGDLPAAVAALEQVLNLDPRYVAAYFQLGQVFSEQGAPASARSVLEKGIAAARHVGDAHAAEEMRGFLDSLSK